MRIRTLKQRFIPTTLFLASLLLLSSSISGQVSKGKKLFFQEEYRKALPIFEALIKEDSTNAEAYYYSGICYLQNYDNELGLEYINRAISLNPSVDAKHQAYWLGIAHHYNAQFDSATIYFTKYKSSLGRNDQRHEPVDKWLYEIAGKVKKGPLDLRFWVEELDGLNTKYAEHSPLISKDGKTLMYTSKAEEGAGTKRVKDGDSHEDIYRVTLNGDGLWSEPEKISHLLKSKRHDASCQLFDNDQQMLIYRWKQDGDLFVAKKKADNTWGEAKSLPKTINTRFYESHGFITADGKSMYFASNRDNDRGDLDLYVSTKNEKGEWGEAKKLSRNVNSFYDDDAPYVTPDGKELYFSSRGHDSQGGFDIFRCRWNEKFKVWGPAQNLGAPINTPEDDIYLVWENSGQQGYLSSSRIRGKGEKDIYKFGKVFDVKLEGVLYSANTKKPLSNIALKLTNKDYNITKELLTGDDGKYSFSVGSDLLFDLSFSLKLEDQVIQAYYSDSLFVPLAKQPNVVVKHDFYIPEATQQTQLVGSVKDLYNLDPLNGKLIIRDVVSQEVIQEIDTKDGTFKTVIEAVPSHQLTVDLRQGDVLYEGITFLTSKEGKLIKRNLKIDRQSGKMLDAVADEGVVALSKTIADDEPVAASEEVKEETTKAIVATTGKSVDDIEPKVTAIVERKTHDSDNEEFTTVEKGEEGKLEKKSNHTENSTTTKEQLHASNSLAILRNVYFDFNDDRLNKEALNTLNQVAEILKSNPDKKISLTGHTDLKGSKSYNSLLSKRRTTNVYNHLINRGVPKSQLSVAYQGEQAPTAPHSLNGKEQANFQQLNRRVELIEQGITDTLTSQNTLLVLSLQEEVMMMGKVQVVASANPTRVLAAFDAAQGVKQFMLSTNVGETYAINFLVSGQSPVLLSTFIAPRKGLVYRELSIKSLTMDTEKEILASTSEAAPILPENIYYDFDRFDIRPDAALELDQWVTFLLKNPSLKIELISHSNSGKNKAYNIAIAKERIAAAASYLNKRGIEASRIHEKLWFGEAELTGKCKNGQDCELNRSTEIRVIEE